ncbi:MAG TPA: hypothetical protein VFV10_05880 [Gammaproteobacteria bacterium]|nr:hypothetical protein [Gammaproteobacteria bacterium]
MKNTIDNHGIVDTSSGKPGGHTEPESDRRRRKPTRFAWLFEEWVLQAFLLTAVIVALVDGFSSVNRIPFA